MRRLHLPIQDPCHEDWDLMNRSDGARRFCDSCAKHVHDVSSMTEQQARTVLADESKTGRVCVRYTLDARTGRIKYKVETVTAPAPSGFSGLLAAASVAVALLGTGCIGSEPTRIEADRCVHEFGPWSFDSARGEGSCPALEPEAYTEQKVDDGRVIEAPHPDTTVAGGLGAEPIKMGEAPATEAPPLPIQPVDAPEHARMGKIAAPPTEHVKMGDVGPIDEPCDAPADQAGTTITPTTPPTSPGPRRL